MDPSPSLKTAGFGIAEKKLQGCRETAPDALSIYPMKK
jgi:hypothetical protein